jgi:hypothetical protein
LVDRSGQVVATEAFWPRRLEVAGRRYRIKPASMLRRRSSDVVDDDSGRSIMSRTAVGEAALVEFDGQQFLELIRTWSAAMSSSVLVNGDGDVVMSLSGFTNGTRKADAKVFAGLDVDHSEILVAALLSIFARNLPVESSGGL